MPPRAVSIVIPNYNGEKLMPEFLPSVVAAAASYAGESEILVVDDRSTDGSRAVLAGLASRFPGIRPVLAEKNGGFPAACNLGARAARHSILFFLNNDAGLSPAYFDRFSAHFEDPSVFVVSPAGYLHGTDRQIDGIKTLSFRRGFLRFTRNVKNDRIRDSGAAPPFRAWNFVGAYFFIRADRFWQLGGFDEIYCPYLMEETDLAYRGLKRGWTIAYDPDAVGHHRVSSTILDGKVSSRTMRIHLRNRLIFHWKNLHSPGMLARHLLLEGLRLLFLNISEWRAVRDASKLLPEIRERRRREKAACVLDDAELLAMARSDLRRYRVS